jgi:hypothetical protein
MLGLGMGAARLAQFQFAIGLASTRIKKNVSNMRQIKGPGRSCDDDQLGKFLLVIK